MTQRVATPAGEPHDAEVDECGNCPGRRITRLRIPGGKWRHDDGTITCPPPPEPTFHEVLRGTERGADVSDLAETIYTGPPDEWVEVGAFGLICNLDGYAPKDVDGHLRDKPVWTRHAGWEFNGRVWWQDGQFHEQVWRRHQPVATYSAETLDELYRTVNDAWGWE